MIEDLDSEIEEVVSHLVSIATPREWILDFVLKHANSAECELCVTIRSEDTHPLLLAIKHPACDWQIFQIIWDYFWTQGNAAYANAMNYALSNPNADPQIIELACELSWSTLVSDGKFLAHDIGLKLSRIHQVNQELVNKFYRFNDGGLPDGGCDFFRLDRCPKCGW